MTIYDKDNKQEFEVALYQAVSGQCPAVRIKVYEIPLVFGSGVDCGLLVEWSNSGLDGEPSCHYATDEAIKFFDLDVKHAEFEDCDSLECAFGSLIEASPRFQRSPFGYPT